MALFAAVLNLAHAAANSRLQLLDGTATPLLSVAPFGYVAGIPTSGLSHILAG